MSYQYIGQEADLDEEYEDEELEQDERKPRLWVSALVCLALVATGSGAAFAWHGYGGGELMTGALTAPPKAGPSPQAVAAAQEAVLKNLTEAQQRAAAIAQHNQDLLQAQAADIKRLSEAVAQLSTRVEGMSVRNAQAAVPPPVPPKRPAPKVVQHKPAAPPPISLAPEEKKQGGRE